MAAATKISKIKKGRAISLGLVLVAAALAAWQLSRRSTDAAGSAVSDPLVPIVAGTAEARDMPVYLRGIGTVQAYNAVAVHTRVDGQIVQVRFSEGQEVKAGDPLFQIDPRPFQAALDQAQAAKERDQAQLQGAQLDLERYAGLLPKGFQSRQSYDDQKAQVGALQGAIKVDQAQIESAKLNLAYADIRSPIAGRTSALLVDLGNYVQASQNTSLVTITQLKPIYVSFTLPQASLDTIRQYQAKAPLDVIAYGSDDKTKLAEGKLTLIDNHVDTATGTIHLKATYDNSDERLWPGEFVAARLVLWVRKGAVTVPSETVMQSNNGAYVYVIKPDNSVERRDVEVASVQDGLAVITKGVSSGERVVVDGQYRLTNGAKVKIDSEAATAPAG
ncbi:MAG TPA: efflux RND transporter periplasmic adaptor subunit [Alphaproteobacteria bacterium]|nr:efflux RND transporter periplasmic adaptor subunit [Alphaproteobacteria bacterium]